MIRLHDNWRSSASYRVRIALGLAALAWESAPVNLLEGAHRQAPHLARNPQGVVPVLEIDGRTLTQSLAIIEYLDETRGLGLLPADPADPAERARVRAISHAIAMEIHPVCNLGVARHAVSGSNGGFTMESWMQHFITRGFEALEPMLGTGNHCHGDGVTLADLCLLPQVYNAHRWQVDMATFPRIARISDHLGTLPAFAAAHPDLAPH